MSQANHAINPLPYQVPMREDSGTLGWSFSTIAIALAIISIVATATSTSFLLPALRSQTGDENWSLGITIFLWGPLLLIGMILFFMSMGSAITAATRREAVIGALFSSVAAGAAIGFFFYLWTLLPRHVAVPGSI